jgi:hypothetical protein
MVIGSDRIRPASGVVRGAGDGSRPAEDDDLAGAGRARGQTMPGDWLREEGSARPDNEVGEVRLMAVPAR